MCFKKIVLSVAAAMGLTACGGGGSNGSDGSDAPFSISPTDPASSIDALNNAGDPILDSQGFTQAAEMPVSGTATYTGIVGAEWTSVSSGEDFVDMGTANFSANFNSSTMTMTSSNFAEYSVVGDTSDGFDSSDFSFNRNLTGSLSMTDGVIGVDRFGDGNFTGTMSGTLIGDGVPITYNADVEGFFIGDNAQAISGGSTSGDSIFFAAIE